MHHKIVFGLLFYGHFNLLVKCTNISRMLIICVLLNQLLSLPCYFLSFFNRRIFGFIISCWNSSDIFCIPRWLTVTTNFFVDLVDDLLRGQILFMGSSSCVLIEPLSVDDDFACFISSRCHLYYVIIFTNNKTSKYVN